PNRNFQTVFSPVFAGFAHRCAAGLPRSRSPWRFARMALFDMPLESLREYRPALTEPTDLMDFWERTLSRARGGSVPLLSADPVENGVRLIDTRDVTFAGHGGAPVRGWYNRPAGVTDELPVVVEYIGYGGGRGEPLERLAWAA